MSETWVNENLCCLDSGGVGYIVRVERAPKRIELEISDANLSDEVTAVHYKLGRRDALGRLLDPAEAIRRLRAQVEAGLLSAEVAEAVITQIDASRALARIHGLAELKLGDKMMVADWRRKHSPYVWYIYRKERKQELQANGTTSERELFNRVGEVSEKEAALEAARQMATEMNGRVPEMVEA